MVASHCPHDTDPALLFCASATGASAYDSQSYIWWKHALCRPSVETCRSVLHDCTTADGVCVLPHRELAEVGRQLEVRDNRVAQLEQELERAQQVSRDATAAKVIHLA